MPLADFQFSLASLAFVFGRRDLGNDYDAEVVGLTDRNVERITIPFIGDGEFLARVRRVSNTAIFTVSIDQPDAASAAPKVSAFRNAWDTAPEDEHLHYKVPGITNERYVIGAPGQLSDPFDESYDVGLVIITAEFYVPQPVIYDAVTNLPVPF